MKDIDSKLVGILGTLIFHLVAAIIFMSFQLKTLTVPQTDLFIVEFDKDETVIPEEEKEEKKIDLPLTSIERIFADDPNMLNIARNLANKSDVNIDPNEYIDMVKEEMIKNGMLGEDNYIDAQKKLDELISEETIPIEEKVEEPTEAQVMEANYQGPTRIYYDLEGRNHTYLPIPIYKCPGSGIIALTIQVDQRGNVTSAKIKEGESTTTDQCLLETAINSALISRFNPNIDAPKSQVGTLTYHFVAQ